MAIPPPDVVRAGTDQHVLELLHEGPLSRAELAARGGFSKPTASESVRRLEARGLVGETGDRRHGVGRTATLMGIRPEAGVGLAVTIEPTGISASTHSVPGEIIRTAEVALGAGRGSRAVKAALGKAVRTVADGGALPIRVAAVSAADPVRRSDGRLAELPDAPFLVGSLDPRAVLSSYVDGDVHVDNDVNWAASAELSARSGTTDFGYLHLGPGLGGAVVTDGAVRRGQHGFVGEIAHIIVAGPRGRAMPITRMFAEMGLRQPDSSAIDVSRVRKALQDRRTAAVIGRGLAGVASAFVALADPEHIVVAGEWGDAARQCLEEALQDAPRPISVVDAAVQHPSLVGVRDGAVSALRRWISTAAVAAD
ncbi:ROK family transcriptional regulator [Flexivirga sp. B27]